MTQSSAPIAGIASSTRRGSSIPRNPYSMKPSDLHFHLYLSTSLPFLTTNRKALLLFKYKNERSRNAMIDLDINYKLSAIRMSKKNERAGAQKHRQPKKEIDESVLARFQIQPEEKEPSPNRRRLKKLCEVNESEEMLEPSGEEDNLLIPEEEEQEPKYQQFELKDDEELQKEREAEEEAKKNKGLKGNQQLDKFIQKQTTKPKTKEEKPRPVQMTIAEMMRIKKQKQMKRRKSSDEFIDNDASSDINQREIQAKRMAAYEQYNGSLDDEEKQIEKAIKLSLTASSINKHERLEDYAYGEAIKPVQKPYVSAGKSFSKEKEPKESKEKKQIKEVKSEKKESKKTKTPKEVKTGPLAQFVIVFTGEFQDFDKDQFIEVCAQLGAECPKSITKKCNLLIQGSYVTDGFKRKTSRPVQQTSKSIEAVEKGIKILAHDKIDQFFIEKTGFSVDYHLQKNKVVANPVSSLLFKPIQNNAPKEITNRPETYKQEKMDIQQVKKIDNSKQDYYEKTERIDRTDRIEKVDTRLWSEKHKPTRLQQVIGETNQVKQLRQWLESWEDIHIRGNKRDVKPTKGWGAAGTINSTAALLSGDPGIGKTTTARLLAMEFNYSVTEFNASDVRNKSGVGLLETRSYGLDISRSLTKSLVIMDEVDGMSSGDRGGVAAIINLIKSSKVPIICICNDRSSEKIRSLAAHCLDIKFHKPNKLMVVKRLKEILHEEGGSGEDRALEQLVETFQNDMRQILSYLQVVFKTISHKITIDALSGKGRSSKDANVMINHFQAAQKLLNRTEFIRMRISERTDCFFVDSDMVPLMVHENLLSSARKSMPSLRQFHKVVQGVHGMVVGDVLDRSIRKEQEYGLMPSFAFMTCVYAPEKISESMGYPSFPSWLGKYSSERKVRRLAKEFKDVIFPQTLTGSWKTAKGQYAPIITRQLSEYLRKQSIDEAINFLQGYRITPIVISQHLASLYYTDKSSTVSVNPMNDIPSNVKGKLTRIFNKRHGDKIKEAAKGKAKIEHAKFNPILQEEQVESDQAEEQEVSEEVKVKAKAKDVKKKK